jgi:membrane protease YdiL (CAAX protease family)
MRAILVSAGKILAFLGIWTAFIAAVVMNAVFAGGQDWFQDLGWRFFVEVGGALGVFAALAIMARLVDRRGWDTLGFRLSAAPAGLVGGALLGAAMFAAPVVLLMALGLARWAPELAHFSASALGLGLIFCVFNVIHQELLVRSYMFQELWAKFGAIIAAIVTTLFFVALHAGALMKGAQGLIAGANVLLASLLLSLAYVRTRALWLPIGVHFGWNCLQGPVLHINVTGADVGLGQWRVIEFANAPLWTGGEMGVEGGLAGLAGPLLGFAFVAVLVKQPPSGAAGIPLSIRRPED